MAFASGLKCVKATSTKKQQQQEQLLQTTTKLTWLKKSKCFFGEEEEGEGQLMGKYMRHGAWSWRLWFGSSKKKFSDVVLFLTVFLSSCELTSSRIISDKTDTKIEWNPVLKMSLLENTNQIAKWLVEEDFGVTTFLPQRIAGSVCMYDN